MHLWSIKLIGHDLGRHTPVCIHSNCWQCISEQKSSLDVEGTACRAQKRVCVEAHIWERQQKNVGNIEGFQEHYDWWFLNGRSLYQPGPFTRTGCGQTEQSEKKGLGRRGDQEHDGQKWGKFPDKHHCNTINLDFITKWPTRSLSSGKDTSKLTLSLQKKHLKDSQDCEKITVKHGGCSITLFWDQS